MSAKNNLKDKLAKLDEIVTWFEQDDLDVEAAIAKYEEGAKLSEDIRDELKQLENNVTVLRQRFDQQDA